MPDHTPFWGNAAPGPRGPFTAAMLRPITDAVIKVGQKPGRGDLEHLAAGLNLIHGTFVFGRSTAANSKASASRVRTAFETLSLFFEERKRGCFPDNGDAPPSCQIIDNERRLYNQFYEFMDAFRKHPFELDMDAALLMPDLDTWRDIAWSIAGCFKLTMSRTNGGRTCGWSSNDGPAPRFVAAVIPLITGERPKVPNVGKFLKDEARSQRKGAGERR